MLLFQVFPCSDGKLVWWAKFITLHKQSTHDQSCFSTAQLAQMYLEAERALAHLPSMINLFDLNVLVGNWILK